MHALNSILLEGKCIQTELSEDNKILTFTLQVPDGKNNYFFVIKTGWAKMYEEIKESQWLRVVGKLKQDGFLNIYIAPEHIEIKKTKPVLQDGYEGSNDDKPTIGES
jgi:hypothetical protein